MSWRQLQTESNVNIHTEYKFSAAVHSDDLGVVNCLRALAQYSQKHGNNRIPWGGTKDSDWRRDNHCVTFHFSTADYRKRFLVEIERLLPVNLWKEIGTSDDDPASPQ